MSRLSAFNSPLLLGFDHFDRLLDRISKTSPEGYPPYNIEQISENGLRITLAVAGFSWDDLSVALEDNQLVIRGRQADDEGSRIFIHRGIASRQFQRAFLLADGMEVMGASLDNGLLHVDLIRRVPEPKVRTIPIGRAGEAPHTITVSADEASPVSSRARTGHKREV
ncbi:Putative Molecular chaperone(HSP20-like chaperone,24-135) [Magnetospirillum sp. XM-1]|uniref:Hsp20 family protein n=1 Tax=Magnetospirillum sp. XM-1 TaxID=1663591 RepID=UPI00073DC398|nr:Hsp20 family protein [Magnetospirillum sp. XM-1]CUW38482.1 Putative Molecular chaperone(HSP20-like chaperone,24-135) [Magnetospirillum sp. XM-1]